MTAQMYFCKSYGGQEDGAFVWKDVGDADVEDDVGGRLPGAGCARGADRRISMHLRCRTAGSHPASPTTEPEPNGSDCGRLPRTLKKDAAAVLA
jgi:hypothetical protein